MAGGEFCNFAALTNTIRNMKKFLLLCVAIASVAFVGCSDDDDESLKLNKKSITLHSLDEFQIECSGTNVTYKSKDTYVAGVDEFGKVTAMLIGETDIEVVANEGHAKLHVIVAPKYNLYKEPYTDWGKSKNDVVAACGNPDESTDTSISYAFDDIHIMTTYMFENNKLKGAVAAIHSDYATELASFLCERYIPVGNSGGMYLFVDRDNKTVLGMRKMSGYKVYQVAYAPYDSQQNLSSQIFSMQKLVDLPKE